MLCQWFVLFVILPFHLSFSYLRSADVLKFLGFFQVICTHVYVYKYICRETDVFTLFIHTQTHVYVRVCIKRVYSTGLKISPCKTSFETDLPENSLLSTIPFEDFCYLVLLSLTLVWYLPFASVMFSFLSQNGMPLGIGKVYRCLGQHAAPGQQAGPQCPFCLCQSPGQPC